MKTLKSIVFPIFIFFALMSCSNDSSSDDGTIDNTSDGYIEPSFNPNSSWIYMEDCPSLVNFYAQNNRQKSRKWVASKKALAYKTVDNYFMFSFENTDKFTRYLTDKLNPNGKETLTIEFYNFEKSPPQIGTYIINDLDKTVWCEYDVFDSNGIPIDHPRTQSLFDSSFTITNWTHVDTAGKGILYTMTGSAILNIMYWETNTNNPEFHKLFVTFNKVEVIFED